jgi:gliding motility-associated-like protein
MNYIKKSGYNTFTTEPFALGVTKNGAAISSLPPSVCAGTSVTLTAIGGGTYTWGNNGATTATNTFTPTASGYVTVLIDKGSGCIVKDSVLVTVNSNIPVSISISADDNAVCSGTQINFTATPSTGYTPTYQWYVNGVIIAGATSATFAPSGITNGSSVTCTVGSTVTCAVPASAISNAVPVTIFPTPSAFAGNDTTIYAGSPITLNGQTNATNPTIIWAPTVGGLSCVNCPSPSVRPTSSQLYTFNIIDANGCEAADSILVKVLPQTTIFIPNAFSPNGDGLNDGFGVIGANIERLDMKIYNRWGELIFATNDVNKKWDGTYKGTPQELGVYVYLIKAKVFGDSKEISQSGNVTLIR